jgi:hypothetical protein
MLPVPRGARVPGPRMGVSRVELEKLIHGEERKYIGI